MAANSADRSGRFAAARMDRPQAGEVSARRSSNYTDACSPRRARATNLMSFSSMDHLEGYFYKPDRLGTARAATTTG